jgi:zinc/manganese transport system substrate-binding protein
VGYSRKTFALLCGHLLAALILTSGCAPTDREPADKTLRKKEPARQQATDNRPIRVVATYSILGDWVQTIGGDEIELTVLVGAEGDAHTYEPTPRDSVALAEADILFENGMGFEVWLERLFQASNSAARRVIVTEKIKPRQIVVSESRTEIDPHVWHLPENAKLMVEAIALALEQADPAHATKYRDRQRSYVGQLNDLDAWITQQAASIPAQRRKLVTTHDTFGYLADRYDFEVLSVLGSVSSESSDPSAGQVAEIIERIRTLKIPAIFAENILNPKLTLKIAEEAGVKIVPTLYTDALGPAGSPGQDYLGLMRFNVKTIVEALR